ncbi:phosphatase PAP2 family protein [Plantactinospora soyae]|uniref:Undecaprenyl-diphosphatase n=1 Tax=Plantactinospora soyae TaxID=1544732 RepID=A0A927MDR9_9ACTN|nr:phosphatase PAP2 family protein [Plantactinospora soyae]MBE1492649.1 undecaprenyl-diphosphatase [Plantactinospora soyae]
MIARPPLVVPLLALAGFLVLLALTAGGWAPLEEFDDALSDGFRGYGDASPTLVDVLRVATDVAATVPFVVAGLVISIALATLSQRRPAMLCALVTVSVPVLWGLMHWLVHHPRPVDGFVVVESNGFPSGHTSNAAAAALAAVLLLWPHLAILGRVVTVTLAVAFAVFVGLTRLALLAHWPADVLGGWLLALVVVPLAARAATRWGGGAERMSGDRTDRVVR